MLRIAATWIIGLYGLLTFGAPAVAQERATAARELATAAPGRGAPRAAAGDSSIDRLLNSLRQVHVFTEVAISPDGSRVAWVESLQERESSPSRISTISVLDLRAPGAAARRITGGKGTAFRVEREPAWSPDGKRLAFLSDREKPGQLQLYVAEAPASEGRKLTSLKGALAGLRWSPDGKSLSLLFIENSPRSAGPLEAAAPDVGVIEERVYQQRIAVVDPASGRVRQVSPPNLYIHEYDWSPDGRSFAATAAPGAGDANWYIAELYVIDAASGQARSILKASTQIGMPRWSPDGKSIAFIGGLMSDEPALGGDVFAVPAAGGDARNLTPGMKASASWLTWLPSSDRILCVEIADGESGIASVDPATGAVSTLWRGPETITSDDELFGFSVSLARDGKTSAVIHHSFEDPPEIWAGAIGAWRPITRANREFHPSWGEARSLHWTSGGFKVQGWLISPARLEGSSPRPMIVKVHGGPAGEAAPAWPGPSSDFPLLSSAGYFVFMPNPRGSFGQGEEFTRANVKDFGYGDLDDIIAGVDEVIRAAPVDPRRIGIGGWSYGGFMTMWAVTRTDRFRAAVAGAGIANWQSYYGQNGIDQWMIPYFGASVYDDPRVYARSSPINFIKNVTTPTLILVGERDLECPAPQSFEFWHALKTLGVETRLVVYPGEGHRFAKPDHRRDRLRRTLAWYDAHLR